MAEPRPGDLIRRTCSFTRNVDTAAKTIDAIVSTVNLDRDREIILPSAWTRRLDVYRRNPLYIWSHDPEQLRNYLGRGDRVTPLPEGLRILFDCSKAVNIHEDARIAFDLVEAEILNAFSVGFRAYAWAYYGPGLDPAILAELGDQQPPPGTRIYTDVELMEVSLVGLPSNIQSLVIGRQFKSDDEEEWSVCGSRSLPLADADRSWDGAEAESHMRERAGGADDISATDWTEYRRGFVLQDENAASEIGGYKLSFADVVDGELKAVPQAIHAAAGAVQGAREDLAVPDDVKEAARTFLAAYYKKLEATPPWEDEGKAQEVPMAKAETTETQQTAAAAAPVAEKGRKGHPRAHDIAARLHSAASCVEGWSWPGDQPDVLPDPDSCASVSAILMDVIEDLQELVAAASGTQLLGTQADHEKSGKVLAQAHADTLTKALQGAEHGVRHTIKSMDHVCSVLKAAGYEAALPEDFPDPKDPMEDTAAEQQMEDGDGAARTDDGSNKPGKTGGRHPLEKGDDVSNIDPAELHAIVQEAVLDGLRSRRF